MKIIIVLAIVFAAYFVIRFLQAVTRRLGKNYEIVKKADKLIPLVISFIWLIIVFWSAYYLFYGKSYYNLIIICLIIIINLLIGWFFIKDFIAGVIFRVQNNYTTGDFLQFGEVAGHIEDLYLTHITLQTKEGRLVRIPYSRLSSEIISHRTEARTFEENTFVLKTNKKQSAKETEEIIRNILLTSPWRVEHKLPVIKLIEEDKQSLSYEIQVQARNQKHFDHLMEVLKERINN